MRTFLIGSRGSQLALWQAHFIAGHLAEAGFDSRIEIIKTTGDDLQTASLTQAGGKGLFTKEIEEALWDGQIDLAVHSLKDLPTESTEGLTIAAVPLRANPLTRSWVRGWPIWIGARWLERVRHGGRRSSKYCGRFADAPIRGNVDTRLRKQQTGEFDAILLAAAGLERLGLADKIAEVFAEQICPAPGQGALGIQTREDGDAFELCKRLNHTATSPSPCAANVRCWRG